MATLFHFVILPDVLVALINIFISVVRLKKYWVKINIED